MENLLGAAGVLLAGAATPGPNHLLVWHTLACRGFAAVLLVLGSEDFGARA